MEDWMRSKDLLLTMPTGKDKAKGLDKKQLPFSGKRICP
jgi:hypothetical protein